MPPSLHKLGCFVDASGISDGGKGVPLGPTAHVVSPFGKVWRVEVGRDGDGAFLGSGWPEFLAAHGVGVGWFVVLRHQGGGLLTFKAFDTTFCIKEFAAPAAVMTSRSSKGVSCKPQFLRIARQDFMEKMIIPDRFVKKYLTGECLNRQIAVIVSPLGKFWRIELQKDQSGNMVFKFKVFGLNGCQKVLNNPNTGFQQNCVKQESAFCIKKRKADDERARYEEVKRRKITKKSLDKGSSQNGPKYQIGPSSWIKKEVTAYMLKRLLSLPIKFCHSIGFRRACTIMLKTAMDSTTTWQVRGLAYKNVCYLLGEGWRCFCKENKLKNGDLCTFNIIDSTLWHVDIMHSGSAEMDKETELPCSSSMERKSNNYKSGTEEQLRPESPRISLVKASSYTRCAYEIGPPSWIKKEIKTYSLQKHLFLAQGFCNGVGLRDTCMITLKTSIGSTRSWLVRGAKQRNGSYLFGSGWKKFSQDNELKVGDVCTFNIAEMLLWHVAITRA
ncbi:hypothetical protein HU200_042430 [Digitaria exilis]|uniref:TF-B3 domain-containing protein n=1 Tax=Digitaria exilis TaxID=1010633 RepID=A0A835B5W0_9POAL|nr:hypothetical protein HU200_042430 [Digitaria exilis]